jgi:hypothetical protein
VDRYINNKTEIEETSVEEKKKKEDENKRKEARINDTLIKQAITFNQTISDFYGTTNPSDSSVDQATNYYIQKMSKIKADDPATRASAMIPVSLNFTTDGISGLNMGQGFTISKKFLPYTYNDRNIPGVGASATEKVGFVVFGLNHNFENNQWNTDVRANMIYLKKIEDFKGAAVKAKAENKEFRYNENNVVSKDSTFVADMNQAKISAETYLGRTMNNKEWSALVSAVYAEASRNQTEEGWVMAVILNRSREAKSTILDTLSKPNQFQAVTGTKYNNNRPSPNYVTGPNQSIANDIYTAALRVLPSVPKNYRYFTSANLKAYGLGTDVNFFNKLKSQATSKTIGQTIFSTTA